MREMGQIREAVKALELFIEEYGEELKDRADKARLAITLMDS